MDILEIIALILIIAQGVFTIQILNNVRYALSKARKPRSGYRPRCALIVPCKGLDENFQQNIRSFYQQDYEGYSLIFVVDDASDPACPVLGQLKEQHAGASKAAEVRILIAGKTRRCSQKLHNLLFAVEHIDPDTEILAFADSDACASPQWLSHLVYPLRETHKEKTGASTGYRWFLPKKNNFATLALSAVNAKVAQLLGNTRFKLAWGG